MFWTQQNKFKKSCDYLKMKFNPAALANTSSMYNLYMDVAWAEGDSGFLVI